MLPGLAPDEDRNPQAAGDPVTHVGALEGGEHGGDVGDPHAVERTDGEGGGWPAERCSLVVAQGLPGELSAPPRDRG